MSGQHPRYRSRNLSDESPRKQGPSLVLTAVLGLVGAVIPTLVIMMLVKTCEPPVKRDRTYRYEREKPKKRDRAPEVVEEESPDTLLVEEDVFLSLEEGLLALAPGVYLSVRFLHEDGVALTPNELDAAEGVHTIEITVKSEPWDQMKPEDRVELLNDTFKFIKDRYPEMTKFLRLVYDDDRPAFDMKFGAEI